MGGWQGKLHHAGKLAAGLPLRRVPGRARCHGELAQRAGDSVIAPVFPLDTNCQCRRLRDYTGLGGRAFERDLFIRIPCANCGRGELKFSGGHGRNSNRVAFNRSPLRSPGFFENDWCWQSRDLARDGVLWPRSINHYHRPSGPRRAIGGITGLHARRFPDQA